VVSVADVRDDRDTAVVVHRVSQRHEIVVSYRLRVVSGRRTGRLVVTRLEGRTGDPLVELYVTRTGLLRLSSAAGVLRRRALDVSTGVRPDSGADQPVVEWRLARQQLTLRVDGRVVARVTKLDGPAQGDRVVARIGIDRYDGETPGGRVRAEFDELVVGAS
jgi:hypothetical protein